MKPFCCRSSVFHSSSFHFLSFLLVNSVALHGDGCPICQSVEKELMKLSRDLDCSLQVCWKMAADMVWKKQVQLEETKEKWPLLVWAGGVWEQVTRRARCRPMTALLYRLPCAELAVNQRRGGWLWGLADLTSNATHHVTGEVRECSELTMLLSVLSTSSGYTYTGQTHKAHSDVNGQLVASALITTLFIIICFFLHIPLVKSRLKRGEKRT